VLTSIDAGTTAEWEEKGRREGSRLTRAQGPIALDTDPCPERLVRAGSLLARFLSSKRIAR
jgi:hypothetical protein